MGYFSGLSEQDYESALHGLCKEIMGIASDSNFPSDDLNVQVPIFWSKMRKALKGAQINPEKFLPVVGKLNKDNLHTTSGRTKIGNAICEYVAIEMMAQRDEPYFS